MSWGEIVRVQLSIKLYIWQDDQGTFILSLGTIWSSLLWLNLYFTLKGILK